ncbi:transporter substrate-binding domain-containing protein [Bacillus alveayuensis]|jgi:arginine/lysine/histidine transporter system substrate-binding protein|uniref:Polar amino acid transport system substrate-binding protein n=1 Tax=Aeribacillus alveayuensis TaxID=279215 RepID=A0ABT9VKB8_9BACI|nr:transporter substrate-binding domain-containing protein [Bacillus alveayuensis]MDQ0161422.1 polar amino acid transport system substrate-binding protein [Bacillus alveayuensis]
MKKWFYLLIMVLTFSLLASCGTSNSESKSDEEKKEVLVMGTSADYAPFEYIDTAKGSDIIGIDVDIAKAITERLGYELEIQDMDFNGLIPALQSNKVDFVLAGMSVTPERKESVDFSDVYYSAKHMIVSKADSGIQTVEDLEGKTVGVQLASVQEEKANEIAETINVTVENRNRISEVIQEIKSGRFDAAIIEDSVAKGYLEKDADLQGFVIEEENAEENGYAIAFPKGSELTEKFNEELQKMKESGELEEILVKWFDGE